MADDSQSDGAPDSAERRNGEERRKLIDLVRVERGEPERRSLGEVRRDDDVVDELDDDAWE